MTEDTPDEVERLRRVAWAGVGTNDQLGMVTELHDPDDLRGLERGARVLLTPTPDNPLHKKPIMATYSEGYFYCDGSRAEEGPDYYWRDVFLYNRVEVIASDAD